MGGSCCESPILTVPMRRGDQGSTHGFVEFNALKGTPMSLRKALFDFFFLHLIHSQTSTSKRRSALGVQGPVLTLSLPPH